MTPSNSRSVKELPSNPSLGLLANLAKELRKDHRSGAGEAFRRLKAGHPRFASFTDSQLATIDLTLRDAQLVIAREYGFDNWVELKRQVVALQEGGAADVAMKDLIQAANNGDDATVRRVLEDFPDIIDERGGESTRTALHFASMNGHKTAVESLLGRGADPNIRCEGDNATPLHFAAEKGRLDIVELLLSHGADPNGHGDVHGLDVIGWALCYERVWVEVAECLLAHGARHNIFSAVAMGDTEEITRLVSVYRDALEKPMAVWEERKSPLHLAVVKKQPLAVAKLIELGAGLEITDVNGLTPLDRAALSSASECTRLLIEAGAQVPLPAAFGLGQEDRIETLMSEDPDCLKPGGRWERLMGIAVQFARGEVIESLLRWGASVDQIIDSEAFGTRGYTPLHEAAWFGNMEAVEVLVEHGSSLQAKDATYDSTPLDWADVAKREKVAEFLRGQS